MIPPEFMLQWAYCTRTRCWLVKNWCKGRFAQPPIQHFRKSTKNTGFRPHSHRASCTETGIIHWCKTQTINVYWESFFFNENFELASSNDILNSLKNPSLPRSGTKDDDSDSSINRILTGTVNLYISWSLPNEMLTFLSTDSIIPATPRLTSLGPSISNQISSAISLLIAETSAPESSKAMVLNMLEPFERVTLIIGLLLGWPLVLTWWYL